jgi:pimeloyl-ACP methyl ester carboxylesterase
VNRQLESDRTVVEARPLYLQTIPDPTFATVHLPCSESRGTIGVVLCPPFGWSEICTHRSRRAWANALADAGYPTMRIDLPGTGDSAGSLQSPNRLAAWKTAVAAASASLRDEFGCSRICALGIGFGGMLAWLTLADGAPIDDLVLWGVPMRGRHLLRELRVAAKMDIDWRAYPEPKDGDGDVNLPDAQDGGLVDQSGQQITNEIVESIAAIDLRRVSLPDPDRRRVLLLQRGGVGGDEDLAGHLQGTGVSLTVKNGDGLDAMLRYVQDSVVPEAEIASSIEWLSLADDPAAGCAGASRSEGRRGVTSAASVQIVQDGVAIRETPALIELPDGRAAAAVITEPVGVEASDLCTVFFGGGSDRRIGTNRMWVDTARRFAARGVSAVRVDPPGLGDADGDERAWDRLHAHYAPIQVERTVELLDALEARGLPGRFLLIGFCSGAYRSMHVAVADPRIAAVFALGLRFFRWTWWAVNVHDSWLEIRKPRPEDSALKLRVISLLQRCLGTLKAVHRAVVVAGQILPNRGERMIRQLTARGTELLFVLKPSAYANEQLVLPRRRARLRRLSRVQVETVGGHDDRFRPPVSQRFVQDRMDDALTRLIPAPVLRLPAPEAQDTKAA